MNDGENLRQTIQRLLIDLLRNDATLRAEVQRALSARLLATAEAGVTYAPAAPTELSDYLDFSDPAAIRLRGHRIWIEDILYEHVYRALSADELAARFPSLTPAELHAVLFYYYHHQAALDRHLAEWLDHSQRAWAAQQRTNAPVLKKLRRMRAERDTSAYQTTASPLE